MTKRKPGRPRKFAPRHACGRLVQPTLAELEVARDAQRKKDEAEIKSVVRAQPHRAGFDDPDDKRLETALGRFVATKKLPEHCWRGGRSYAALVRDWRALTNIPGTYTEPRGEGQDERTVEEIKAEADAMAKRIGRINLDLTLLGQSVYVATRMLVLDELRDGQELPDYAHYDAIIGLGQLAVEFDHIKRKTLHPFSNVA